MNLVQINERLKDLPMQVVQQYANGMNPEVPPYLALGELQRRELSQKQMATAQGAQQGPQPSVKEQVEQKAGLMQLQQMQQQQMAQQQAQPRGPMPVPAGVPQPEDQPEVMMARGGLAGIPVRRDMFEYAGGGIIAFQAGGPGSKYETPYDRRNRENREAALRSEQERGPQALAVTQNNAATLLAAAQKKVADLEADKDALVRRFGEKQYQQALLRAQSAVVDASSRGEELVGQQAQLGQERVAEATPAPRPAAPPFGSDFAAVNPADMAGSPVSGLPAALQKAGPQRPPAPPMPSGPRPAPAAAPQTGLPDALPKAPTQMGAPQAAAIPVSPDRSQVEELMKEQKRDAPTAKGVIADVTALMPAGMQEAAQQKLFADQRARAEERKAMFEKTRPSGLDDLIRVFGQAGQYKGLSGMGPAYTANQQQKRAEELAFQRQQDELLTAIEGRSTAADKGVFEARTGAMDKAQSLFGQSQKSILEAATKKLESSQGRLDKEAQLNMQRDLKMFEMAQEERLKGMDLEQRERERKTTAANNPAAQAAQFVALKQRARDLREKGQTAEADKLDAQAADMVAFKSGSGTAAVGAENSQTRMLREALKDVNSRLEFMDPKDPEYKTLSDQSRVLSKRVVDRALKDAGESGGGGPKIGEVQQGFRFKGGNPADQSNWEKVK
jgi:hypothetical protein